jgi:hypothetical protein
MNRNNCYAWQRRDTARFVKHDVAGPKTDAVQSPWRAELVALLKTENTEHAAGFNAGLCAAIKLLERHEQERQQLSARAIQQRKADGKKIGGDVPYGYQIAPDGETLIDEPKEQRVIAHARKLRASPLSLRAVARKLRAARMYPRNHDPDDPRSPSDFQAVQIQRMLDEDKR